MNSGLYIMKWDPIMDNVFVVELATGASTPMYCEAKSGIEGISVKIKDYIFGCVSWRNHQCCL